MAAEEREDLVYQEVLEIEVLLGGTRRIATLPVTLFWTGGHGTGRERVLEFQVSDTADLLFLYAVSISEVYFRELKRDQSLVVDFIHLADELVLLLETARQRKLRAFLRPRGDSDVVEFGLVETNQFKNLSHLAIVVQQVSDVRLKDHLASRLRKQQLASSMKDSLLAQERQKSAELQAEKLADRAAAEERFQRDKRHLEEQAAQLKASKDRVAADLAVVQSQLHEMRQHNVDVERERDRAKVDQRALESLELQLREAQDSSLQWKAAKEDFERKWASVEAEKTSMNDRLRNMILGNESPSADLVESVRAHLAQITSRESSAGTLVAELRAERDTLLRQIKKVEMTLRERDRIIAKHELDFSEQRVQYNRASSILASFESRDKENKRNLAILQQALENATTKIREIQATAVKDKQIIEWLNRELNVAEIGGNKHQQAAPMQTVAFRPSASVQRTVEQPGSSNLRDKPRLASLAVDTMKEN